MTTPEPPLFEEKFTNFKHHMLPREGRLGIARNYGLEKLHSLPPTDYVIMIDLDILGWDNQGNVAFQIYNFNIIHFAQKLITNSILIFIQLLFRLI